MALVESGAYIGIVDSGYGLLMHSSGIIARGLYQNLSVLRGSYPASAGGTGPWFRNGHGSNPTEAN